MGLKTTISRCNHEIERNSRVSVIFFLLPSPFLEKVSFSCFSHKWVFGHPLWIFSLTFCTATAFRVTSHPFRMSQSQLNVAAAEFKPNSPALNPAAASFTPSPAVKTAIAPKLSAAARSFSPTATPFVPSNVVRMSAMLVDVAQSSHYCRFLI